jgi:hypothetical protein
MHIVHLKSVMSKITGGCLCGKVTFELGKKFTEFHCCHCTQCQKISGSAHTSDLLTDPANINWLSGEDLIKRYDVPGRDISSVFCIECGAVPFVTTSGTSIIVPAASLNEPHGMVPDGNIFWFERAEWYDAALKAKKFAEFPE